MQGRAVLLPLGILLGALAVAYSVLIQPVGCNQTANYALVQSLADGTPRVDRYREESCDLSYVDGHYYSAKSPGLAFATLPWYALLDAVGAVPRNPGLGKGFPQAMLELPRRAIWQVRLLPVVLPALLLVALFARFGEQVEPGTGVAAAALVALGTLVLPYATDYFVHVPAAALSFAAFALLFHERGGRPRPWLPAAAGALAGVAAFVEFSAAILILLLAAYAAARPPRLRRGALFFGGATLGGALPLALFNTWSFGAPHRAPYQNWVIEPGDSGHDVVHEFTGLLDTPSPRVVIELLFDTKGLFTLSPLLAAAAVGLVLLYGRGFRAEALVAAAGTLLFLGFNAVISGPFGGFVAGPRYLIPVLPFLALGLPVALSVLPGLTLALGAVSVAAMTVATAAEPMLGGDDTVSWLRRWRAGDFTQSVVTLLGGGHAWLAVTPFLLSVAVASAVGVRALRVRLRRRDAVFAAAGLLAWLMFLRVAFELLRTDRAVGEPWGAVAVAALVLALTVFVARAGTWTSLAALPLAPTLLPALSGRTKVVLAAALLSLALAAAGEFYRGRRERANARARTDGRPGWSSAQRTAEAPGPREP